MNTVQTVAAIGGIVVAFITVFGAFMAVLFRGIRTWASIDRKLTVIEGSVTNHITASDQTHRAISEAMTADRQANNERLTWLERNVYNSGRGHRAGTA